MSMKIMTIKCGVICRCLFEFEKITKIGTGFVQHSFGLRFAAVVICAEFIEAVKAIIEINAAGGALCMPSDNKIISYFFFTLVTGFHESENTGCAG